MAILIIDDSAFVLKTHQGMIEKTGYNDPIYTSTDGGLGIDRDSIQIAGHEGAMGYVIKPIKPEVLAQKLERALHFSPRLHP